MCRLAAEPGAVVVDVRPAEQFSICHLPGALHAPYKHFDRHLGTIRQRLAGGSPAAAGAAGAAAPSGAATSDEQGPPPPLYVVCRRGNDSQRAVAALRAAGIRHSVDVVGGMEGWAREVDPSFPTY